MERKLEGERRYNDLEKKSGMVRDQGLKGETVAGQDEARYAREIAAMRQEQEAVGAVKPRGREKKTSMQEGSIRATEKLYDVASGREAKYIDPANNMEAVRYDRGATSERDRDLSQRDRARAIVERREKNADKQVRFAETAWDMLRNGEMTQEEYDLQDIDPELTRAFAAAEHRRFSLTAAEMLRNGEIDPKGYQLLVEAGNIDTSVVAEAAKGRAETLLERGKQRRAQEDKANEYSMLDQDTEVESSVAEKKRRLADMIAERDARRADQEGEKKKTG